MVRNPTYSFLRSFGFVISLLILCADLAVAQTDRSQELAREGADLMAQGRFETAIERLREAREVNPLDPQIAFLLGAAYNRTGDNDRAIELLERSRFLVTAVGVGAAHPQLHFERGWALLRLERFEEAIEALERYERNQPGRGKTSELLGRAYIGTGEYDLAEFYLNEAYRRDPSLEPSLKLALAALAEREGNRSEAAQELTSLANRNDGNPISRLLQDSIPRPAATARKNWLVYAAAALGYHSNPIGLSEAEPAVAVPGQGEDYFLRVAAGGFYRFQLQEFTFSASYGFQGDFYEDATQVDQMDHVVSLTAARSISGRSGWEVQVQDRYTRIDYEGSRNSVSLRPAVWWRAHERVRVEIATSISGDDYAGPVPVAELDRDSRSLAIAPKATVLFKEWLTGDFGLRLETTDADGADYDNDAWSLNVRFQAQMKANFSGQVFVSYEERAYDDPNSFSPTGASRDDEFLFISMKLERPLWETSANELRAPVAYLQFDYVDRDSNLTIFSYEQSIVTLGIKWSL